MRILIDADGCPVVNIVISICQKYSLECILFCDSAHYFQREGARTITVSKGADSVDFALVNYTLEGDIIITQDYGLAAMCLAKKTIPMNQNGMVYTNDNIDALLLARHTAKKVRRGGGRLKGPRKRTASNDQYFEASLLHMIANNKIDK